MMHFRLLFSILALALGSVVLAAGTPADTEVTNQASATYNDSSGTFRTTTSNQVVTIVDQVHAFSITPDQVDATTPGQTKVVLSGADAYFNYVISNTGNGTDEIGLTTFEPVSDAFNFDSTSFIRDGNCNGTRDPGESPITSLTLAADASACIILAATTPGGQADGDVGDIDLHGTYPNGGSETGNVARAVITEAAALDARMSITPSGEVDVTDTLTVTVSGSNVGASAAYGVDASTYLGTGKGIVITQALPAGVTFADGLTGTAGGGTVQKIYFYGTNWSMTPPGDLSTVQQVGIVIKGTDAFFAQTASYTYSFDVDVDDTVAAGTVITHEGAGVQYSPDDATSQTITSNDVSVTIDRTYSVLVGPVDDPEGATSDTQTIDVVANPVYTGDRVVFEHTLKNTGNTDDNFALDITGAPVGWTCSFLHADGTTPISGSVGPFPLEGEFSFMLACSIPQDNDNAKTETTTLTVSASSLNDTTAQDATIDVIPEVKAGYAVAVTSNGEDTLTGKSLLPSNTLEIPFDVTNTGENDDVYNLGGTVPVDWNTVIYDDANCDDAHDGTIATKTPRLAPKDHACFVGVVLVPEGATPMAATNMGFVATSTTDVDVSDGILGPYSVAVVASISLNPNRNGTVTTPGTIDYDLELRNGSNTTAAVTISSLNTTPLTYQFSTDETTWSNPLVLNEVKAGTGTPIYVRVIVPAGQPIGMIDTQVIESAATFEHADAPTETDTDTATLTSTVVSGELTLTKSARVCEKARCDHIDDPKNTTGETAVPKDYIEYTLVAKNIGTDDVTHVILMDPLPNYTTFESATATTTATYPDGTTAAEVLFSTDGDNWSNDPTSLDISAGQAVYVGIDTETDGVLDVSETDALKPGEAITITLTVQLQ